MDSSERLQLVMLANLVTLYCVVGVQILRQVPPMLKLLKWLVHNART